MKTTLAFLCACALACGEIMIAEIIIATSNANAWLIAHMARSPLLTSAPTSHAP